MKSRTEIEAQNQTRLDREASRGFRGTRSSLSSYRAEAREDRKHGFVSNASFFSPPVVAQTSVPVTPSEDLPGIAHLSLAEQFNQMKNSPTSK